MIVSRASLDCAIERKGSKDAGNVSPWLVMDIGHSY